MKLANIKTLKLALVLAAALIAFGLGSSPAHAMETQAEIDCRESGGSWVAIGGTADRPIFGCTTNSTVDLDDTTAGCKDATTLEENCIVRRMVDIINFLSVGIGIIAVGMIIWAGIEYTVADANPQRVASAKAHILNVVIGLVAYIFLYTLLNFLIPGGLIG